MGERVLIVDDDGAVRLTLKAYLESQGLTVESAGNGAEALDLLRKEMLPQVILLDLMMPVLSGWQFLDLKAKDARLKRIPVILTTSFEHEGIRLEQVVAMVRKPFDLERVLKAVRSAIAGGQLPVGAAGAREKTVSAKGD